MKYLIILSVLLFIAAGVLISSMSTSPTKSEHYLASELHGHLIDAAGMPQANIQVTRTIHWAENKEVTQETVTDASGSFTLPEYINNSFWARLFSFLPGTSIVRHDVSAHLDTGEKKLFSIIKTNTAQDEDFVFVDKNDTPIIGTPYRAELVCNISAPENLESQFGICRPSDPVDLPQGATY